MTQALLAEPLASKQTRARWSSFGPARKPLKLYDWAEPGDPPCADFASVRADPIAKPVRVDSLTREVELALIRRYRQDGDIEALDRLLAAHRPMVVRMARSRWRGNGTSLAALVEYGMFGLRLAAEPPCASQTKKGELVGFDPRIRAIALALTLGTTPTKRCGRRLLAIRARLSSPTSFQRPLS
jgi:hypothetical protein